MALFWFVLASVLAVIEIFSPIFGFILVSIAAFVGSAAAEFGVSLAFQIMAFLVTLLFTFGLLRPRIVSKLYSKAKVLSRTEILFGKPGTVIEAIDPVRPFGRVHIQGEDWAAASSVVIGVGAEITVIGSEGIVLLVSPKI